MTDKNTAALAADHTEHHLEIVGRWYMVNRDGMATLCTDRADALAEIAAIRAESAELRAQLEAIGAGGVTGPLIARTVVKAADHFPDAGEMVPAHWYMVDKIGMAMLCSNRADAEQEAKDATLCYPHMAPHRAVQLAPAGDMAKLRGQRMVLCSLLGECRPVIEAMLQMPGDDDSDARLNGLAGRITGALNALAEEQVMGGES